MFGEYNVQIANLLANNTKNQEPTHHVVRSIRVLQRDVVPRRDRTGAILEGQTEGFRLFLADHFGRPGVGGGRVELRRQEAVLAEGTRSRRPRRRSAAQQKQGKCTFGKPHG